MMLFLFCSLIFLAFFSLDLQSTIGDTSITDVRFTNASTGNPGSVEVQHDGDWYHLCGDTDYTREALVICRQIGYIGGWARFVQTASPRGLNLLCDGNEETLGGCDYFEDVSSPQSCIGNETVGVWCYNSSVIHLVDGLPGRPNIGRVQIQYDDTVTDVCSEGDNSIDRLWTFPTYINSELVCKQLGYIAALMTSAVRIQSSPSFTNVYTDDYKCVPDMKRLQLYNCLPDPPVPGKCTNDKYVHVVCALPEYIGCFSNSNTDFPEMHASMTVQRCIRLCRQKGTPFAILGAENGCRCQGGLFGDTNRMPDSQCNTPCAGDPYGICGGPDRISVYNVTLLQCKDPGVPMNGSVIDNAQDKNVTFDFGSIVKFVCDAGFLLIGSPSIQCVVGIVPNVLVWNASTPICQEIHTTTMMTTSVGILNKNMSSSVAATAIGVTTPVVLIVIISSVIFCILFRRYRRNKSPTQTEETVNRDSNIVSSSAVEGISNAYASTAINENGNQNIVNDRNDKTQSQHIYASSEVKTSSEDPRKPKPPINSSDLPYDYADVKKETSHARTPPGVLYASVKKGKYKSSDLSYDKPGDESAGPSSSSELPYNYAEVNGVVPSARMPPGVQHASVTDNKGVRYDQPIRGDKYTGQTSSSELPYDYADVTKAVPGARMPPGTPSESAKNGDQASSTNYDLPIHSNKSSDPEEAAPYAYAYAGVNKDKSTGQTTSTESPYDYADVKKVVPGPRMPPESKFAKAREEGQASNYDQPIHNSKSLSPANEPAPYAYAYAGVNKDKPEDRQQSAHLYAYADVNELNKNKSSSATPNGHHEDNGKDGWAENTLYGKSGKNKEGSNQEGGTNGGTEGWKKNSIYQSGAAHV